MKKHIALFLASTFFTTQMTPGFASQVSSNSNELMNQSADRITAQSGQANTVDAQNALLALSNVQAVQETDSIGPKVLRYESNNMKQRKNNDGSVDYFRDENIGGSRMGRKTKTVLADNSLVLYEYDENKILISVAQYTPDGSTIKTKREFDANGRLKKETRFNDGGGLIAEERYDDNGRLTDRRLEDGSTLTAVEFWGSGTAKKTETRDVLGHLTEERFYNESGSQTKGIAYYVSGNIAAIADNATGIVEEFMDERFNNANQGRLVRKTDSREMYVYSYHGNTGNIKTMERWQDGRVISSISYDEQGHVLVPNTQHDPDKPVPPSDLTDPDEPDPVLPEPEDPQVDKTTILSSIKQSALQVMGMSAADIWFFDLNADGVLDHGDVNMLDDWDHLTADQMKTAFTRIWAGLQEHIHGHPNSVHCQCMSHLDFNGDGMLDAMDLKLVQERLPVSEIKVPLMAATKVLDAMYDGMEVVNHDHMDHSSTMESEQHSPVVPIIRTLVMINNNLNVYKVVIGNEGNTKEYQVFVGGFRDDQVFMEEPTHAHTNDAQKATEHEAMMNLVKVTEATHAVIKNGNWSDASIWADGRIPAANAKIWIPLGVTVTYDVDDLNTRLEWLRVEGTLNFATNRNTSMKVETIAVDPSGVLTIGTDEQHRVDANVHANVLFADRGQRDKTSDPFDLSGGLISHGQVKIFGAEHSSFLEPDPSIQGNRLTAGVRQITMSDVPKDWKAGDRLIIAATVLDQPDEELTIESINGKVVTFNKALVYSHLGINGVNVPIGNITRNVTFQSENKDVVSSRGHIMIMHNQTKPTLINSAAFYDLGRTTIAPVTDIKLGADGLPLAGTDDNTRGRYSVHFHMRSGASYANAPHEFKNSAIVGGLKIGLSNHGAYVMAEDNITYDIDGSHFFTENGTELGVFHHNLAIRSNGNARDPEEPGRVFNADYGHGGYGFWMQGGGVDVTNNYAFGHSEAGYIYGFWEMKENGKIIQFDVNNLRMPVPGIDETRQNLLNQRIKFISIEDVPYYFANNVVAASRLGYDSWEHFRRNQYGPDQTIIDGFTAWNIKVNGMVLGYEKRIKVTDVYIIKNTDHFEYPEPLIHTMGISVNSDSEDMLFDNLHIDGFHVGMELDHRGKLTVQNSYINASAALQSRLIEVQGRERIFKNMTYGPNKFLVFSYVVQYNQENMIISMLPEQLGVIDTTLFEDSRGSIFNGKQFFYPNQHPDYIPFAQGSLLGLSSLTELNNKTNKQLWEQYHLSIGGVPPPQNIINGNMLGMQPNGDPSLGYGFLADPINREKYPEIHLGASATDSSKIFSTNQSAFTPHVYDNAGNLVYSGASVALRVGWNILDVVVNGQHRGIIVLRDETKPTFDYLDQMPAEMYPGYGGVDPATGKEYGYYLYVNVKDVIDGITYNTRKRVKVISYASPDKPMTHTRAEFDVEDKAGNVVHMSYDIPYPAWYLNMIRLGQVNPLAMTKQALT